LNEEAALLDEIPPFLAIFLMISRFDTQYIDRKNPDLRQRNETY
jgi:hypothetical protein